MADQPHIIDDGFSEPEQVRKIFVGNLPYEADEGMGTIFYIYNQLLAILCDQKLTRQSCSKTQISVYSDLQIV